MSEPGDRRRASFTPVLPTEEGNYGVAPGEEPVPWFRVARFLLVVGGVVGLAVFVVVPGYQAGQDDEAEARIEECTPVAEDIRADLETRADLDGGSLVAWAMRESAEQPGHWFVSAEYREQSLAEGADGEIATWLTTSPDLPTSDYGVMEPVARDISTWDDATDEGEITDEGAIGSRFCTAKLRTDKWSERFPSFD